MCAGFMYRPDLEQDPYYALYQEQLRQVNQMYQNPLSQMGMDPYGLMGLQALDDGRARQQAQHPAARMEHPAARGGGRGLLRDPSPYGAAGLYSVMGQMGQMGNTRNMMALMQQQMAAGQAMQQYMMPGQAAMQPYMLETAQAQAQAQADPSSQFVSHSSVMTYDGSGGGTPKVYQATSTTRQAPGGVRETKKTVRDSEAGIEKLAVGHHIQDQAHVITKQRDVRSGDVEENQDFVNLEEAEADSFNQQWRQRMSPYSRPQPGGGRRAIGGHRAEHHPSRLALSDGRQHHVGRPPYETPPK